jgi:hypothetical protein
MEKDLNQVFDGLLSRHMKIVEQDYQRRYKGAKDKEYIKDELKKGTDFVFEILQNKNKKLVDVFSTWYKRGEGMNEIIVHLRKSFGEVDDVLPFKIIDSGKAITLYLSEEEKALKKLALDERKLLKLLVRYTTYQGIQKRLPAMFNEAETTPAGKTANYQLKWTGKKDNKNELVQLIYGLHKAGFINEGKGEITKIVESLAEVFKVDLGKGWQANHSGSIHKAKSNYQPLIFHKIREAYHQYIEEQIETKKKMK